MSHQPTNINSDTFVSSLVHMSRTLGSQTKLLIVVDAKAREKVCPVMEMMEVRQWYFSVYQKRDNLSLFELLVYLHIKSPVTF